MARRGASFVALGLALMALAPFGAVHAQTQDSSDPAAAYQWSLETVGARAAHKVGTGKGIVIAIIDTGVDLEHEDLKAKLVPGRNVMNPEAKPQDDDGQGTHVAGLAAAITGNGKGVMGVAPDAKIMPIKVLDADGDGDADDIANGLRWAADNGAHVAYVGLEDNLPQRAEPIVAAVRYAWALGVVPVVPSGNSGIRDNLVNENAVVVAATTRAGGEPSYPSGVGNNKWGIAAPGGADSDNDEEDILSTYWPHVEREPVGSQEFGRYAYESGTSMAAGHLAGALAIMRGLGLSPQRSVERLVDTARDIGPLGRDTEFGAGMLDLAAAVKGMSPPPTTTTTAAAGATTTSTTSVATTAAGRQPRTTVRPAPSPTTTTAVGAAGTGGATFSPPTTTADDTESSGLSAAGPKPPEDDSGGGGAGPAALAIVAVLSGGTAAGGWWWRRRTLGEPGT